MANTIDILIRAYGTQAKGELADFDRGLKRVGDTAGRVSSRLALFGGAGAAGLALFGRAAFKTAASMEQTRVAFTTMLKSSDAATKSLQELSKFARETPFEFGQVTDASKKLLAYGYTAKQLIPTLTILGDATGALGLDGGGLDRLIVAFGQIKAKATLQAQDLRQLAEAGIPVFDILSKKLGLTSAEIQDIGKHSVSSVIGLKALSEGMNERFGGGMAAQAKTMNGIISNLKDLWTQFLSNAEGTGLGDMIAKDAKPALESLYNEVMKLRNEGKLDEWAKSVGAAFGDMAKKAGDAIKFMASHPDLTAAAAKWGAIAVSVSLLGSALAKLTQGFLFLWGPATKAFLLLFRFGEAAKTFLSLAIGVRSVAAASALLTAALTPVGLAVAAIAAAVALLVVAWKRDWGHIREVTASFFRWFSDNAPGLNRIWDKVAWAFVTAWGAAIAHMKGGWTDFLKWQRDNPSSPIPAVLGAGGRVGADILTVGKRVAKAGGHVGADILDVLNPFKTIGGGPSLKQTIEEQTRQAKALKYAPWRIAGSRYPKLRMSTLLDYTPKGAPTPPAPAAPPPVPGAAGAGGKSAGDTAAATAKRLAEEAARAGAAAGKAYADAMARMRAALPDSARNAMDRAKRENELYLKDATGEAHGNKKALTAIEKAYWDTNSAIYREYYAKLDQARKNDLAKERTAAEERLTALQATRDHYLSLQDTLVNQRMDNARGAGVVTDADIQALKDYQTQWLTLNVTEMDFFQLLQKLAEFEAEISAARKLQADLKRKADLDALEAEKVRLGNLLLITEGEKTRAAILAQIYETEKKIADLQGQPHPTPPKPEKVQKDKKDEIDRATESVADAMAGRLTSVFAGKKPLDAWKGFLEDLKSIFFDTLKELIKAWILHWLKKIAHSRLFGRQEAEAEQQGAASAGGGMGGLAGGGMGGGGAGGGGAGGGKGLGIAASAIGGFFVGSKIGGSKHRTSAGIGGAIGAGVGYYYGGPLGAAIGSVVGAFVGILSDIIRKIVFDLVKGLFKGIGKLFKGIGKLFGGLFGGGGSGDIFKTFDKAGFGGGIGRSMGGNWGGGLAGAMGGFHKLGLQPAGGAPAGGGGASLSTARPVNVTQNIHNYQARTVDAYDQELASRIARAVRAR